MKTSLYLLAAIAFLFTSCASNNVTVDDSLGRYFDSAGVKGNFALLDNGQGRFIIYDLPGYRDSLYSPGATFDIVQSLIAIQTGVVNDGNALTTDTSQAASFSLANRIGYDTLKRWIDSLHYGNRAIRHDSTFGDFYDLKITPDEQLGLTKRLYFNQLRFYRRPQELVKAMLTKEVNSNYQLVYKTARIDDPDHVMGWVMGWVEENKHPYFFVLHIQTPDKRVDIQTIGVQLIKHILGSEGFFQGKK